VLHDVSNKANLAFGLLSKQVNNNNNSTLISLRANLTAQRPITKTPRVRRKKQQQKTYKQNT
jgi:hypothetical protein